MVAIINLDCIGSKTCQSAAVACHGIAYAMLCPAVPCCAMLCPAVPCCALLCPAVPCCATLCPAVAYCAVAALGCLIQHRWEAAAVALFGEVTPVCCFIVGLWPPGHCRGQQPVVELILHRHRGNWLHDCFGHRVLCKHCQCIEALPQLPISCCTDAAQTQRGLVASSLSGTHRGDWMHHHSRPKQRGRLVASSRWAQRAHPFKQALPVHRSNVFVQCKLSPHEAELRKPRFCSAMQKYTTSRSIIQMTGRHAQTATVSLWPTVSVNNTQVKSGAANDIVA